MVTKKKPIPQNRCTYCGRRLSGGFWIKVPLKDRKCSFCIENEQKIRVGQKDLETRSYLSECSVCGELKRLKWHSTMCNSCYQKSLNPKILSMEEVGSK